MARCSRGDGVGDHPLRRRRAESRPGNGCLHCRVERRLLLQDVKRFDQGTHNIAEYQALILGLRLGQARRAACGGQGRLDARGEASQRRVEDEESDAAASADAGRGAVGAVRELRASSGFRARRTGAPTNLGGPGTLSDRFGRKAALPNQSEPRSPAGPVPPVYLWIGGRRGTQSAAENRAIDST